MASLMLLEKLVSAPEDISFYTWPEIQSIFNMETTVESQKFLCFIPRLFINNLCQNTIFSKCNVIG